MAKCNIINLEKIDVIHLNFALNACNCSNTMSCKSFMQNSSKISFSSCSHFTLNCAVHYCAFSEFWTSSIVYKIKSKIFLICFILSIFRVEQTYYFVFRVEQTYYFVFRVEQTYYFVFRVEQTYYFVFRVE